MGIGCWGFFSMYFGPWIPSFKSVSWNPLRPTIYSKIGFIIQLKQPCINGWPWGSRFLRGLGKSGVVFKVRGEIPIIFTVYSCFPGTPPPLERGPPLPPPHIWTQKILKPLVEKFQATMIYIILMRNNGETSWTLHSFVFKSKLLLQRFQDILPQMFGEL